MLTRMYEIKDEFKAVYLKLLGNAIFFVYRIKGVSSDVGKLCRYFQSLNVFNLIFQDKNIDRINDCDAINAFAAKLELGIVEFKKKI